MQETTNDMSNLTNGGAPGLPVKLAELRPWEIVEKFFRTARGKVVDVEHATDEEFQFFVTQHRIPVQDNGIAEWSFDDRVRTINHALRYGVELHFVEQNNSESELFEGDKPASQVG